MLIKYAAKFMFFYMCINLGLAGNAQIVPDQRLPNNSKVENQNNTLIITNGTQRGPNLFHSFESFNVNNGQTGRYEPNSNIRNIFSRVTGGGVSRINGSLESLGRANLFFLNQNGILFGPGASINIGGSFTASTAERIEFSDGLMFNNARVFLEKELSVRRPEFMYFENSGDIVIVGNGHELRFSDPNNILFSVPVGIGESDTGLRSSSGKSISLFGSNISVNAGVITSSSGDINVGAVKKGRVGIRPSGRVPFDYRFSEKFGDISFTNTTLLDASGPVATNISIYGGNINITDNSLLLIGSFGNSNGGEINLNASKDIFISSIENPVNFQRFLSDAFFLAGGIVSENFGNKKGAGIAITAKNLSIDNAGFISTSSNSIGGGGDILFDIENELTINTSELFEGVFGNFFTTSFVVATSFGGPVGNITVNAKDFQILGGSTVVNQTSGFADGGDTVVNAENVNIEGGFIADPNTNSVLASTIGAISTGSGSLGNLDLNARTLSLLEGGSISYTPGSFGNSGLINLRVIDSIEIGGSVPGSNGNLDSSSQINAAISRFNPFFQDLFGTQPIPIGDAGSINIDTSALRIFEGGSIGVTNEGTGPGGEIFINAASISLDNQATISAATASGDGGNVSVESNTILLNNLSEVSASSTGDGLGGNIDIGSGVLVVDNSSISASAEQAFGGNISINTQGFFLSNSDIQATSALGSQFDGTIEVSTLSNDLSRDSKPQSPPIVLPKVEKICNVGSSTSDERFSIVDGVNEPLHPDDSTNRLIAWYAKKQDQAEGEPLSYVLKTTGEVRQYKRMVGWTEKPNGRIALTSDPNKAVQYQASKPKNCLKANRG